MPDFQLIPGRNVQEYNLTGDLHFRHEDEDHVAENIYVESDYHFPNHFLVQVVTTKNKIITWDAHSHATLPPIAKRVIDQHRAMHRKGHHA